MLLIHHDEAEVRDRCEYGRAGAEYDARPAAVSLAPGEQALGVGEPRVQHRERGLEAFAKAPDQLRGEPDLRHQHQRTLTACQHALDEPQIHLRLAAAGDAVQYEGPEATEGGGDPLHRERLFAGQFRAGATHPRERCLDIRGDLGAREPAAAEKCPGELAPAGKLCRKGGGRSPAAGSEKIQQRPLPRRPPRLPGSVLHGPFSTDHPALLERLRRRPQAQRLRQGAGHHFPERVGVVVSRPAQERQHRRIQHRLALEHLEHRL